MKNNCISKKTFNEKSSTVFHFYKSLTIWLNVRWPDSPLCICVQLVVIQPLEDSTGTCERMSEKKHVNFQYHYENNFDPVEPLKGSWEIPSGPYTWRIAL